MVPWVIRVQEQPSRIMTLNAHDRTAGCTVNPYSIRSEQLTGKPSCPDISTPKDGSMTRDNRALTPAANPQDSISAILLH